MTARENLGDRLAAENGLGDETAKEIRRSEVRRAIERERSQARWLGRAAIVAWALALLLIPAAMILGSLMQMEIVSSGDMESGLGLMIPSMALGTIGGLALVVAIVATIGWIYRGRTASLSAIEDRLDALEAEIRRD